MGKEGEGVANRCYLFEEIKLLKETEFFAWVAITGNIIAT